MSKKSKSVILMFMTAMIWGFAFVAQLLGAEHVGAFTFNGTRFLLGGMSLIPVILFFERGNIVPSKMKTTLYVGVLAGIILFTASSLQQFGIELTTSAGKSDNFSMRISFCHCGIGLCPLRNKAHVIPASIAAFALSIPPSIWEEMEAPFSMMIRSLPNLFSRTSPSPTA